MHEQSNKLHLPPRTKTLLFALTISVCLLASLAGARSANAWSAKHFKCSDRGSRIKCAVTITGAKGRFAHFDVKFETDDGRASRTVRDGGRRIPYASNRTSFTFDDDFTSELWWTQGIITIGDRTIHTHWRSLYID